MASAFPQDDFVVFEDETGADATGCSGSAGIAEDRPALGDITGRWEAYYAKVRLSQRLTVTAKQFRLLVAVCLPTGCGGRASEELTEAAKPGSTISDACKRRFK